MQVQEPVTLLAWTPRFSMWCCLRVCGCSFCFQLCKDSRYIGHRPNRSHSELLPQACNRTWPIYKLQGHFGVYQMPRSSSWISSQNAWTSGQSPSSPPLSLLRDKGTRPSQGREARKGIWHRWIRLLQGLLGVLVTPVLSGNTTIRSYFECLIKASKAEVGLT